MWWISCSTVYGKIFLCQAPENKTAYSPPHGAASFRPLPHRVAYSNEMYLRYINAEECRTCGLQSTSQAYFFANISLNFTIPGLIYPPIALTKRPSLFRMAVRINSTVTLRRKMKIDLPQGKDPAGNHEQLLPAHNSIITNKHNG